MNDETDSARDPAAAALEMGYPMTYSRVMKRNGLSADHVANVRYNLAPPDRNALAAMASDTERFAAALSQWDNVSKAAREIEQKIRNLADDLRRLEQDSQDEGLVCQSIARRTGIDPDVVAGVLKEFMAQ